MKSLSPKYRHYGSNVLYTASFYNDIPFHLFCIKRATHTPLPPELLKIAHVRCG